MDVHKMDQDELDQLYEKLSSSTGLEEGLADDETDPWSNGDSEY